MMLKAYRCKNCGTVFRPLRYRCLKCKSRDFEELYLNHGRLVSYTIIYATREGFKAPVRIGLAEFEHGVKLLAQLDCDNPEVGMQVVAVNADNNENSGNRLILRKI